MGNPALSAIEFILSTVLYLYAVIMALRFVMQTVRADYYNPLAQFVVAATDPLLKPARRVIPSIGRYDTASLLLCFGVLLLKFLVVIALGMGAAKISAIALLPVTLVEMIDLFFNIFIYALFIQAILSWFPGAQGNPATSLLNSITQPVLAPVRQFVPPLGGFDLSVLVAIIGLGAMQILVVGTLRNLLF